MPWSSSSRTRSPFRSEGVDLKADQRQLQDSLGHRFADRALLERALTHRSFGPDNNERLEFLGDALIGLIIAEELFKRFPRQREGELSRLRASLVNGKTLAELARGMRLGAAIRLGTGEQRSGGRDRESILADAMEAVSAAIYLDAGMDIVRARVLAWFEAHLDALNPKASHKDAKTRLQEVLQAARKPLPVYTVTEISGQAHEQLFVVQCEVALLPEPILGSGRSRRAAEQQAASEALAFIERKGHGI